MFRVNQSKVLANNIAAFIDDMIPHAEAQPRQRFAAISASSIPGSFADDSLALQRRRRLRRKRKGVDVASVRTSWF